MSESATDPRPYAKHLSREERRRQILDAALPLYVAGGFGGPNMKEVGEEAGISKPVIYNAFESKDGLAAAVFEEAHRVETELHLEAGMADSIAQVAEGSLTPLYLTAFSVAAENLTLFRFLYGPMPNAPHAAVKVHEDYFRTRSEAIEDCALEYFGEDEDAAKRAHQLARMACTVGYLGLSTLVEDPSASTEQAERLAQDYGRMLEGGLVVNRETSN